MAKSGPKAPPPDWKGMWTNVNQYRTDAQLDRDRRLAEMNTEIARLETRAKARGGTFSGADKMRKERSAEIEGDYNRAIRKMEKGTAYQELQKKYTADMRNLKNQAAQRALHTFRNEIRGNENYMIDSETGDIMRRSGDFGESGQWENVTGQISGIARSGERPAMPQKNLGPFGKQFKQFAGPKDEDSVEGIMSGFGEENFFVGQEFDEWGKESFGRPKLRKEQVSPQEKAYKRARKAASGGGGVGIVPAGIAAAEEIAPEINPWI